MDYKKMFPHVVSGFIVAVGLFFIFAGFVGPSYLELQAPGSHYLLGVSVFFVAVGVLTFYLTRRGKLKKIGITTEEVRQETISKLKDKKLLAKIALEDESDDVRQTAAERLKEIRD